jgi:nicotinate-nucleotide adenylyltransferase
VIGLFGGTFCPPHNGHVALARAAEEHFELAKITILVAARPAHKGVELDASTRLRLSRAAFPNREVELDRHERTVDTLERGSWTDELVFLIGADEFADFLAWKDPEGVLDRALLGVATRPGYPRERLEEVLSALERRERVRLFPMEPVPISSRDIRARVARGQAIDELVPPGVARLIARLGLYRNGCGGRLRRHPERI